MNKENYFVKHLGQTTPFPFLIDIQSAEGIYIIDKKGKSYMDMIAGVAVNNIGHRHPKVVAALKEQIDHYMHVMVYGEYIQDAQINLSSALQAVLPSTLNALYPVNSGTEAIEAAIKLVKRSTHRTEIISFKGAYHGSTNGALSISSNVIKKQAFRPLLPDVHFINLNNFEDLQRITHRTAGVFLETVQGDAGVRIPEKAFMEALRKRCDEVGALLVFDEIQCGMGRTGKMFAFEHYNCIPDVLTLGKALGGGMPIGALICNQNLLQNFSHDPMLGHITTFGGHPVICAAAVACLEVMKSEIDFNEVNRLGALLAELIGKEKEIIAVRQIGMMFAFDMESPERVEKIVMRCLEKGVLTFWFLSHPYSFRLSPPLNITENEIRQAAQLIRDAIMETA
jgi:acetylornithine/succinyldiaminopimelate/putrescine aminotransferase